MARKKGKNKAKNSPKKENQQKVKLRQPEIPYDYKELFYFIPLALFIFVVYVLTLSPTVPSGDSGELIVVSHNLGVAHPPGYPLYTLLAHLFTYIPIGSIAWRVNLFSAVCNLGAAFFIFLICQRWTRNLSASILAAGLFAFMPLVWRYAVVAEVFGMNNLIISALLYILLRLYQSEGPKWAYIFAFTLGLGYAHHHTLVLFSLPIIGYTFFQKRKLLFQPKVLSICVALVALGMTPYLYLPWASAKKLLISWGDLSTWDGFWIHFFRKEYGTFQLATGHDGKTNLFLNLKEYFKDVPFQFLIGGLVFSVVGIYQSLRQKKKDAFALMIFMGLVSYLVIFHHFANMDLKNRLHYDIHTRFWQLPNLILCIFLGYGWHYMTTKLPQNLKRWALIPVALIVAFQMAYHFEHEDHSENTVFYDLGKVLLDGLPQNSVIWMRGDVYVNSVRYMQASEHYRQDVIAVPFDLLWWPWMGPVVSHNFPKLTLPGNLYRYSRRRPGHYTLRELFQANTHKFPTFIGKLRKDELKVLKDNYKLWNIGFTYWAQPRDRGFVFNEYQQRAKAFHEYSVPPLTKLRDRSWEAFVFYNYWERELDRARVVFMESIKDGTNMPMIKYGAEILENVTGNHPKPPAVAYKNLGVAYQYMSRKNPKYQVKMVEAWKKYIARNPVRDPHFNEIKRAISSGKIIGPNNKAIRLPSGQGPAQVKKPEGKK